MRQEQEYSQFDRYLSGDMSPEELANFHNSLKADPAMREELGWMESAVGEIRGMGRGLMKERVNAIALLIPDMALDPYKPALTPRAPGFFGKWWPVITATAAAIAIATWFFLPGDEKPQTRPAPESLPQPAAPPVTDTTDHSTGNVADTSKPVVVKLTPPPPPPPPVDNCHSFPVTAYFFLPQEKTWAKGEQFALELCPREKAAAKYSFTGAGISLSANYTDTTGLRLSGTGDTLYLTDSRPGYFLLVKGKTSEPLVRKARKNINPSIGIKPDKP